MNMHGPYSLNRKAIDSSVSKTFSAAAFIGAAVVGVAAGAVIAAAAGNFCRRLPREKQKAAVRQGGHIPHGIYEAIFKRGMDVALSGLALVLLSPVFLVVMVLVRVKLGRPGFFTQERPGKDGKIFKLYKFRTMTDRRDENWELLPDEARLTKFGKKLRSTSLDELPELFNILKGDMSLVGPRPLLAEYLPLYTERQARRHEVRPGLTGLAQVSGRNGISWEEKFEDDVRYVEHISFFMDMKIIFRTVIAVVKREGITSETAATMEKFRGTE